MKICVITLVYNDAERLPFFLRHYSVFADKIIVYYNIASTDRTLEILKSNPLVQIINYDTGGFFNEEMNQHIKNTAWKGLDADWFIVCDSDEYLYFKHPTIGMRTYLGYFINEKVYLPQVKGYQMIGDGAPKDDGKSQIYDLCKYGAYYEKVLDQYDHSSSKQILFHKGTNIVYGPGGHTFVTIGNFKIMASDLKMLHYRYFSLPYILNYYKNTNINPKDEHSISWTKNKEHITKMYNWFYARREKVIE